MLSSLVVYSLWIFFNISVTILAGTLLRSAGAIAGVSMFFLALLSASTGLFSKFMTWSPSNLREHATSILMQGELLDKGWLVLSMTLALSVVFISLAVFHFKRFEQF
ncbi:putative transmembrane protein YxlG [Bacillus sp. THAF10]|uniref:hypothetical protein n=1 Tax=Bacillus sp. THAF10 TaxID=2587848 RepID=UPI0012A93877|nr:hypothetical protein [Bacillus sp. THAF10]QFT87427.1 putative transmembrane protein YxlG [Bacillus sp. THAF10]